MDPLPSWLRRLRHDLVKRLLWPARDRRDMGGAVRPGELVVKLIDGEGKPATPEFLWKELRADAPEPNHPALVSFEQALFAAVAAGKNNDVAGVLALEAAMDTLAAALTEERR